MMDLEKEEHNFQYFNNGDLHSPKKSFTKYKCINCGIILYKVRIDNTTIINDTAEFYFDVNHKRIPFISCSEYLMKLVIE